MQQEQERAQQDRDSGQEHPFLDRGLGAQEVLIRLQFHSIGCVEACSLLSALDSRFHRIFSKFGALGRVLLPPSKTLVSSG